MRSYEGNQGCCCSRVAAATWCSEDSILQHSFQFSVSYVHFTCLLAMFREVVEVDTNVPFRTDPSVIGNLFVAFLTSHVSTLTGAHFRKKLL